MYKTLKVVANFFDKDMKISKKDLSNWFTSSGIRCLEKDGCIESLKIEPDFKDLKMEIGKMYFISFDENTQLVVRLKSQDSMQYYFSSCLHYWNGSESFKYSDYCIKSGITLIREASKPEKHRLFQMEVEMGLV